VTRTWNSAHRRQSSGIGPAQKLPEVGTISVRGNSRSNYGYNYLQSIRCFCRIGIADKRFKKLTLHKNIRALSADTWQPGNK